MANDDSEDNGGVFRRRSRVHFMTSPQEIPPHQRIGDLLEPAPDGVKPIPDESGFTSGGGISRQA